MPELPVLADLIAITEERAGLAPDATALIGAAENVLAELEQLGVRLVGFFVERARADGSSWSEIAGRIGVSRQAAQQRYTPYLSSLTLSDLARAGTLDRVTPRTRAVLESAQREALDRGQQAIEPCHVLSAALGQHGTPAVAALGRLGLPWQELSAALANVCGADAGGPKAAEELPLAGATRRMLVTAAAEAARLGHGYVGSEHLLLGMLRNADEPTARVLADRGVTIEAARGAVRDAVDTWLGTRA